MPCITFILPIYNMERLLPRALRSLRAQTLTDFEAILINDGSKDGSTALCAQAAAEDARFHFIDQPNGGVAAARNAGLDAARGEYFLSGPGRLGGAGRRRAAVQRRPGRGCGLRGVWVVSGQL